MIDFASQIPHLGLSDEDEKMADYSRNAYLEELRQKELRTEAVEVEDETTRFDTVTEYDASTIEKTLHNIKEKWRHRRKHEIISARLMKRKSMKRKHDILSRFPDISSVIEEMVENADIGADRWRRTGVYTFTGDPKKEKRMTFRLLQKMLSDHYGTSISYGTVIELCLPQRKGTFASRRYKSVVNIRYQRARKAFSLKFNPDAKWSRSFYKALGQLQCDGNHILLLNRDDQAGFRLDSTYTHKAHKTLSVKNTVTTFTDFLNKHPTILQTTSYNFTKTLTTADVCAGVVKASAVHQKSATQHMADLNMLEKTSFLSQYFFMK